MRTLWERMAEIYGHKWTSNHGVEDTNGTWLRGLRGLTTNMLAVGLAGCIQRNDSWPPNLPEFRHLCLGFPSMAQLVQEVVDGGKHPISREIIDLIGPWNLRTKSEREIRQMAQALYPQAVSAITNSIIGPERQLAHEQV